MLNIKVTNEQQRHELIHSESSLYFGRQPPEGVARVVIDDRYVSRDQFSLEELTDGRVRLENHGRSPLALDDGTQIDQGQHCELELPVSLTVGQTVIDIEVMSVDDAPADLSETGPFDLDRKSVAVTMVSRYYPYPLAFGFRLLEGITVPAELYREQLRLAENMLAFVGSISLALLDDGQIEQLNAALDGSALGCWQGGISPGHWLTLSIHAAKHLQHHEDNAVADGLVNLRLNKDKKGFGGLMRALIKAKNDHKHDRGPSIESEYRAASESVGAALLEAFELLSFFAHHNLLLVQDVNARRRSEEVDVVFLNCMGDHPGFGVQRTVHPHSLRKGDLYLELESGRLLPLYPFMHAATCTQCKAREFYFVDRLDQDRAGASQVAGLKSFDRGHTATDAEIGAELREILEPGAPQ